MPLAVGQTLSFYEILGPLGTGGMGEVYRARDTRLERDVALKVLPEQLASDGERMQRFKREARSLAALNHPNVAQVFGFDRVGDICIMALELVPGEDLATRLSRGALPLSEAIDVCQQIAGGIEAAHEAGVIHRDLKPANAVITPEGVVKVLDFGLAKPTETSAGRASIPDSVLTTEEGRLLGTPTYMAPEQARGLTIDKRVDVWAFGCVLHECLTGRRAYEGQTVGDVLAAVLEREPNWSRLPEETPVHVRALLERCLDKDPRTRLRDIGEARIVMSRGVEPASTASREPPRRLPVVLAAAIALGAAAAGFGVADFFSGPSEPVDPLAITSIRKLFDWPTTEFDASISRDGRMVAFASDRGGSFNAWWGMIGGGSPRNLTLGRRPSWSPKVKDAFFDLNGANLLTAANEKVQTVQFDLMSESQRPSPLGVDIVNASWSPEGDRMVFHSPDEGDPIFVAEADGTGRQLLSVLESGMHQHYPTWSFDGEWIYVVRGRPATREMDLWRISRDGEVEEQLTTDLLDVGYPAPIDPGSVLFVANEPDGAGPWLWHLDVESRVPRRAVLGVEQYLSIAASLDGRRLVATVANPAVHLKTVPILAEGVATGQDVKPFSELETEYASAPRFADDGTLYFLASGSVWRLRAGELFEVLPASELAAFVPPAVSPNGALLAAVSRKRGGARLRVVSAEGISGPTLSETIEVQGSPTWSPGGDRIATGGTDAHGPGLFVFGFPPDGTPPERLVDGHALNPVWSPTGDLIVYSGPLVAGFCPILGVRPSDGTTVDLPEIRVLRLDERMRFLPDGSGLVYMWGARASMDFWLLDLKDLSAEPRRLTRLEGIASVNTMRTFDVDPGGGHLVFDQLDLNSDVILIDRESRSD